MEATRRRHSTIDFLLTSTGDVGTNFFLQLRSSLPKGDKADRFLIDLQGSGIAGNCARKDYATSSCLARLALRPFSHSTNLCAENSIQCAATTNFLSQYREHSTLGTRCMYSYRPTRTERRDQRRSENAYSCWATQDGRRDRVRRKIPWNTA